MADDAAWDTSKENFQPLRKGRDAKILTEVSAMPQGERATKIKEERSAFWEALATYAGDDPLEVWVRFIKWAEQTFTSGGRETEVLPLLERCTRELREKRFEQYRDDARYLRVWVKYADLCKEPHDIFKFLQANDIGQRHTLFYEAYAAFLEIKGAYGKAAETYDRGVVMRAQPRDRLKDKLAQFQHRMMRREQRKAENRANGVEDDIDEIAVDVANARRFGDRRAGAERSAEAENPGGAPRGGVGGGVAGTVGAPTVGAGGSKRGRGMRGAAAAAAAAASGSANADDGGLEVYCDDENGAPEAPAGEWRNLPAYQETRKENSRAATAWAGQRLKQKRSRPGQAGAPPPGPTLEVYHDEDLVLAEDMAAADAAAAAREARKNANALRRRLDAGGAGESSAGLATDPMLYHKQGAPPPQPPRAQERLYSPFVPSDTTDERGAEVSYEETRARGWMRAHATSAAPALAPALAPAPGPIVPDPRAFATSTATTAPVLPPPPRAPSESPRSRPPLARRDAAPASGGSCDEPPSDAGSGVEGRGREPRSDEARGSGLAPVDPGAAPPGAAAVPAGLRWTATEGGTYGAEPTMTLCTKEAWGDIMSMFSDGAPKAARPPEPAPAADPPTLREATERAARDIGTLEIREDTQFGFGGLDVREDTQFGGLEIREDTVVLPAAPPPPRDPAARAPLAPRAALAPRAPAPAAPTVSAGQNSAAPPVESSDGGLDVYQDTALLDAAAVAAAAGVGSHGSAPLGERRLPDGWRAASAGEPSANGPDEFEVYEDERHAEMENAPPSGHQPAVRDFVPRSIADAAAAAAALQPLPLDLRSEAAGDEEMDDAERENAEAAMRNARPPVELRGEDDFQVYADADDETAAVPKRDHREPPAVTSREPFLAPRATGGSPSFNPLFGLTSAPFPAAPSPAPSGARAPPPTPLAPTPAGSAPDADAGAREPAPRGVTGSALVGYLVDPFDKDAFEARVAQARASFDFSDRAVRVHAGSAALEAVERATKAKGGRPPRAGRGGGGGGGGSVQLVLGDEAFHLIGTAGAGADAVVFEGERVTDDDDDDDDDSRGAFALKVQRASLATWEWVVSERLASRVPAWAAPGFVRLSALHLVGGAGSSAASAASARVGVAAMPFGEHGTLQDALNSYLRVGERMDEVLVMYYAIELLRVVENLHAAGFLHADIKPDNVLLLNGGDIWRDWAGRRPGCWRDKGVALIDFGCAVDLAQYETNVAFVGDVGTEGFRCAEMVEGRPWTFQCDTHQVAATVHALLHGKYMRVAKGPRGYTPLEPLKRYWRRDLWTSFFFQLLNAPTRALDDPPPLGKIRRAFEDHLEAEGFGPKIRECLMRQTVAMYDQAKAAEARK